MREKAETSNLPTDNELLLTQFLLQSPFVWWHLFIVWTKHRKTMRLPQKKICEIYIFHMKIFSYCIAFIKPSVMFNYTATSQNWWQHILQQFTWLIDVRFANCCQICFTFDEKLFSKTFLFVVLRGTRITVDFQHELRKRKKKLAGYISQKYKLTKHLYICWQQSLKLILKLETWLQLLYNRSS